MKRWLLALLILSTLSSCGGGLNCPVDPPECCTNVLTGCGPFDLPFGCSCEDYGLAQGDAATAFARSFYSSNSDYSGTLTKTSSTCGDLVPKIEGTLRIIERKRSVQILVPGYGTINGRGSAAKGYNLRGDYSPAIPICKAHLDGILKKSSKSKAQFTARVRYVCAGVQQCVANYRGTFLKGAKN